MAGRIILFEGAGEDDRACENARRSRLRMEARLYLFGLGNSEKT